MRAGRVAAAIALLVGVWGAGFLAPDLHLALLYLAPALLLATALFAGRYPGEALLERLGARRAANPAGRRPVARHHLGSLPRVAAHGGLLLARRLAGRAPPASREVTTPTA